MVVSDPVIALFSPWRGEYSKGGVPMSNSDLNPNEQFQLKHVLDARSSSCCENFFGSGSYRIAKLLENDSLKNNGNSKSGSRFPHERLLLCTCRKGQRLTKVIVTQRKLKRKVLWWILEMEFNYDDGGQEAKPSTPVFRLHSSFFLMLG
ncbi:hypothetical protein WISP_132889 [Willisornis vidua]|uniref:Uncharacterized protein n=1 Tax=Willisornis vidua TaxID=1566151 RepID=A0ABQ9CP64_9PASS|nr:hypothetical protein WISP_132889 [Willisornis vidua]